MDGIVDRLLCSLTKEDWKIIHQKRLRDKEKALQYTKHSKRRNALIKEILWLKELTNRSLHE